MLLCCLLACLDLELPQRRQVIDESLELRIVLGLERRDEVLGLVDGFHCKVGKLGPLETSQAKIAWLALALFVFVYSILGRMFHQEADQEWSGKF